MSQKPPERRPSALRSQGKAVDPHVQAVIHRTARLSGGTLQKVTVRLPADLVDAVKREAALLTHHRRRGFSDLLAVCARYGLAAYLDGTLEVDVTAKIVEYRIVSGEE